MRSSKNAISAVQKTSCEGFRISSELVAGYVRRSACVRVIGAKRVLTSSHLQNGPADECRLFVRDRIVTVG
jgi:hypothetical protein